MNSASPKLRWRDISKRFGETSVLDGFDVSVAAGQSLVIIGGSGQGKSVAIRLALGLIGADAGSVELDGEDVSRFGARVRREAFRRIGVLFQGAALFDSLTVWENVAFRLLNADGVAQGNAKAQALLALERVRLEENVADRYPAELSGGMQKRVGLARAIVAEPEILFFDEPTTGLDPVTARAINELIVDQVKRLGCTAVSITHDLSCAQTIGDEIAMLHAGRIVWRGSAQELFRTGNAHVEAFIDARPTGIRRQDTFLAPLPPQTPFASPSDRP